MRFREVLLALALGFGASCSSLPSGVLSRQLLFTDYAKARPRVSPDGKRIVYIARDSERSYLWVRSFDRDDSRKIPLDYRIDQRGIWSYFWQGDSRHLLYISDDKGDENFHLRSIDVETADTLDLTPFRGARSSLVAMAPARPNELLVQTNRRTREVYDLYRVDLTSGKVQLVAENPGDVATWIADSQLRLRAAIYRIHGKPGNHIRIYPLEGGGSQPVQGWPDRLWLDHVHGISSDGGTLWFSSDWESNSMRLFEANLITGKRKVLASDPTFDVDDVQIAADSSHVNAVLFNREFREWLPLTDWMGDRLDSISAQLGPKGNFTIVSSDSSDQRWILRRTLDVDPAAYFTYETSSKKLTPLFEEYPEIPKAKLHEMKPVRVQARDGMKLYAYLTEPDHSGPEPAPLILKIHGGPWSRDSWGFDPEVQWLASRGYAVLQINFRGSSGFGNSYEFRGRHEWGRKMLYDLIDGKNWAIQNHIASPGKVGLWGVSYGGYATLAGLMLTPGEFACGVAVNGPSNLEKFIQTAPPYWKMGEAHLLENIGNPKYDHALLQERSPLTHAEALTAPLLVIHGANDARVNRAQSDELVEKLRSLGKPVSYIVLPEGGHTLQTQRYRSYLAAIEDFFGKCLGGVVESPLSWEDWGDLTVVRTFW